MDEQALQSLVVESLANISRGRVSEGLNTARRAYNLACRAGFAYQAAVALSVQAEAYFRFGQYPEAMELARQAEQQVLAQESQNAVDRIQTGLSIRARANLILGRCYAETDDFKAAELHLTRSVDLCRSAGDIPLLLSSLHSISAAIYMPRGQYALALSTDAEVLALARTNHLPENLERPLITMSWVCLLTGQILRSTELLAELRSVFQPATLAEGWACCIQGWLNVRADHLTAAEEEFRRTRSIGETISSPELNINACLGMAAVCRLNEDAACALDWAGDAAALSQRIGYAHFVGMSWLECGRCAWLQGRMDAAGRYFEDALQALIPLQARLEMTQAYLGRATVRIETRHPQANKAVREALDIIHTSGFTFLLDQERPFAFAVIAAGLRSRDKSLAELAEHLLGELGRVPPPHMRVHVLGGLRIWQAQRLLPSRPLRYRRAGELLALLLTSPFFRLTVDAAAEQLSPERTPEAALEILHQAASALRRALEPDLPARFPSRSLRVENGVIQFLWPWPEPPEAMLDLAAFSQSCARQEWEAALDLYQGDFLSDTPYADWIIPLRQHYASLHQRALLEVARTRLTNGNFAGSLDLCRQLHKIEPWHEEAVLLGMRAALACGDSAAARRLYCSLEKALREDLNEVPQTDLRELFRSLSR